MKLREVAEHVQRHALKHPPSDQPIPLAVDGLSIFRQENCTTFEAMLYQPVVCLILQGSKESVIGDRTVTYGTGDSLVVSHDVPVVARVTEASAEKPYLAVILELDLGLIRSLDEEIGAVAPEEGGALSLAVSASDDALIDAFGRCIALADRPLEAAALAPLIIREIHFRLLTAPHGAMLRRLRWRDSHASRVQTAVSHIRQNYKSGLTVADLAKLAGMSTSSFHEHFKSVTATTPLQYQKHLRLMEAKRLLSEGNHAVSAVAYEIGYESLNQFSREYARKFGASPRKDLTRLSASG
ncbi:AraC family transcriptional regulator N-terminal domain-containing protein [Anderseniella sp. Alg231-50]|uniref:AraC family transcriptional regulator N-terminal domain-containing protein n=1 Tax=Anderseniella sp. Alg231-50 TaxID=1922226 RepID=UPI000D551F98